MSLYPYDPEGALPSNKVTGTVSINTFPNKFNVMVPKEAPFFRTDFKLKRNNVTLIEGLDYYLVYYYKTAADAVQRPVFGGILPIGDWDTADYELRTLGGGHLIPQSEVGRYLNREDIKDPRSVDWSELQRYPVYVQPINPPNDFEEAVLQDPVVFALVKIKEALALAAPERDALFERLFNEIALTEEYYNTNLLEIHSHGEHDHKYSAEDVGALRKEATAVDALKAYGYTLAQFVDTAKEHGISMTQINELVDNAMGTMWGSISSTAAGGISVTTHGGSVSKRPKIDLVEHLEGGVKSSRITLEAGNKDTQVVGSEGGWLGSGLNAIILPKVTDASVRPILNGYYILVPNDVPRYLTPAMVANLKATVVSTPTVTLFGNGTPSSPIYGRVNPPNAADGRDGLSTLTNVWGANLPAVVTQKLMTDTINSLSGFALKTVRINNLDYVTRDNIEITKGMIGLGNVQNTTPGEKPVHTSLTTALRDKALSEHTHTLTDVEGSLLATANRAGLGRIGTNGFALEAPVNEFLEGVEDDLKLVDNAVPAWASSGLYYGDGGYLPAPVYGNYGHAGYGSGNMHGEWEDDYSFTFLTTGQDTFGYGLYYVDLKFNNDGTLRTLAPSTYVYQPEFLQGAKARYCLQGKNGVFIVVDENVQSWLVITNGTMNPSKHHGVKLSTSVGQDTTPVLTENGVYFAKYYADIYQPFFQLSFVSLDDIYNKETVTLTPVEVTGTRMFGETITTSGPFGLAAVSVSTNPADNPRVIRADNGYWIGVNFSHATRNYDVAYEDGIIRIFTFHTPYCTNNTRSTHAGRSTNSIDFNINDNTFVIHDVDKLQDTLTESGFGGVVGSTGEWPWILPNNYSRRICGKKMFFFMRAAENTLNIGCGVMPSGKTALDVCHRTVSTLNATFSTAFTLPTATGVPNVKGRIGWISDKVLAFVSNNGAAYAAEVDTVNPYPGYAGFGPTMNHKRIDTGVYVRVVRNCDTGEFGGFVGNVNTTLPNNIDSDGKPIGYYRFEDPENVALLKMRSIAADAYGELVRRSEKLSLFCFGDPTTPRGAFLELDTVVERPGTSWAVYKTLVVCDKLTVTGNVITVSPDAIFKTLVNNIVHSAIAIAGWSSGAQHFHVTVSDGEVFYVGGGNFYNWVGNGGWGGVRIAKASDGTYSAIYGTMYDRADSNYVTHHSKYGLMRVTRSSYKDSFSGIPLQNTMNGFLNSVSSGPSVILFALRAAESWNVYFTQEYPFYAEGKIYTLPVVDFDLRVLFPANYQNRTFYIHVRSDGTKAWYTIDVNKLPDTASRLNVGYVTTDNERIIDLSVKSTRRFGNVGALVRHEANRFAHDSSPETLVKKSQYSELKNMSTVDGFTLPTFKDVFNSWYRFSHDPARIDRYPAYAGELNAWRYLETEDTVECTINSASYIGFMSNELVGDYVFNTVLTSNDTIENDNDSATIILAGFKQGDIDNREHTLTLTIASSIEAHLKTGSNIRLFDNYGQSDVSTVAVLDPATVRKPWRHKYAHVYARRTGNLLRIAVEFLDIPSEYVTPTRDIEALVRAKATLTEEQMFNSSSYHTVTVDLGQVLPKYARAARYGYGALSQPQVRYWNIRRPGADLSNFYGTEETLRLSMRRDPNTYRLIHGKIAPLSVVADAAQDGAIQNHRRIDNYGDKFWPTAQEAGYNQFQGQGLRSIAPGYQYLRGGNPSGSRSADRWFLAKVRFTLPKDGQLSIRSFAVDEGRFWLASDVGVSGESGDYSSSTGITLNVAGKKGNYSILFLIAVGPEKPPSPTHFVFEVKLDGAVICSSNDDTTKAITLPRGQAVNQPIYPSYDYYTIPSAIRIPYDRPEGTAISVSVNRHYGDKRAQIDANAVYVPTSLDMTEHGMNGVIIETTSEAGRFVDNIYIHQHYSNDVSSDITYQIRVTKI